MTKAEQVPAHPWEIEFAQLHTTMKTPDRPYCKPKHANGSIDWIIIAAIASAA